MSAPIVAAAGAAAAAAGAPAGAAGAPAPAAAAGGWSISSLLRMLMLYWAVSSFFKSSPAPTQVRDASGVMVVRQPHRNAWPEHTPYSLYVFVHDSPELDVSRHTAATLHPRSLIWFETGMRYGWDAASERALNWSMSADSWPLQHLQANGSLYAHVFFVKDHTPLFPWRGKNDVMGEDAYTHAHDALVVGAEGTALSSNAGSGGASQGPVPPLSPLPLDTDSPAFQNEFLPNPSFVPANIIHRTMVLNLFRPAPKIVDKKNLLGVGEKEKNVSKEVEIVPAPELEVAEGVEEEEEDEEEFIGGFLDEEDDVAAGGAGGVVKPKRSSTGVSKKRSAGSSKVAAPYLSYWKPFLSLRLIPDWTVFPHGGIPAEMASDYVLGSDPANADKYDPPIYFDYFWLLQDQLIIVNNTVSHLSLNLTHSPLSLMKWRLETQMEASWKMQQSWGMQEDDGRDSEMLKKLIMDTNIYLLALTFAVSILHSVFDFLAFKNDVAFWKNTKSMRGLSTRSIVLNAVCQAIIFLYLVDNDTSYMILLSSGVGVAIEVWKVRKAVTIKFDRSRPFPHIRIMSKSESEDKPEEEKTTEEKEIEEHARYDGEAMKYLSWVLYPLVVCYAGYSLYYESHKSWYSFVLAVLTGCVYTFGFIMMCPQLYINYKLKSVAHLPWRMLTYKALNTFIDDLFAFVITMPTLHRLSCFRDDIIFFIFLYQKWAYRVDFKRANEFGASFVSPEEQARIEAEDRAQREAKEQAEAQARREASVDDRKEDASDADNASTSASADAEVDSAAAETGVDEQQLRQRTHVNLMD